MKKIKTYDGSFSVKVGKCGWNIRNNPKVVISVTMPKKVYEFLLKMANAEETLVATQAENILIEYYVNSRLNEAYE